MRITVAAIAILLLGCPPKKNRNDPTPPTAAEVREATLNEELAHSRDTTRMVREELAESDSMLFGMTTQRDTLLIEVQRLKDLLAFTKADYDAQLADEVAKRLALDTALIECQDNLVGMLVEYKRAEYQIGYLQADLDSCSSKIERMKPWYLYFRHETHFRSIWERILGKDRGTRPSKREPVFYD
ncbi:hypothetical protein ACFL0L_05580 [Patescibacteria group bacterium]